MKNLSRIFSIALLVVFSQFKEAAATHAMGGELTATWLHDSTYRITFRFYRDCSGTTVSPSSNLPLCYYNACASPVAYYTTSLVVVPNGPGFTNGAEIGSFCPGTSTNCTNPASTLPGMQQWVFSSEITLHGACSNWIFATTIGVRNASSNFASSAMGNPWYELVLNNNEENASPVFTQLPLQSSPLGSSVQYNAGAVDPDGDSLGFELVTPRDVNTSQCTANPTVSNAPYAAGFSLTNPFGNNAFSFDATNGQLSFTPQMAGKFNLAIRISDYRNGVRLSSVLRDYQHWVIPGSAVLPQLVLDPASVQGAVYGSAGITGYAGYPMAFCFDASSASSTAVLVARDGHATAIPGSSLSYTGQLTDSVRGCFGWTPAPGDTGMHYILVTVLDSSCNGLSPLYPQSYSIPVRVVNGTPPTAVGAAGSTAGIRVFPNPTEKMLYVAAPCTVDLRLHNPEGRLVAAANGATGLDLAGLPEGIYFLSVLDAGTGAVLKREKVFRR